MSETQDATGSQATRIAVLVSGRGSNLGALLDAVRRGWVPGHIVTVVSNEPRAGALERAAEHGVAAHVIDHRQFPTREAFDAAVAAHLRQIGADLVVLAGFMRVLGREFVTAFEGRLINIHPSLLPDLPGLDTHARAIAAGRGEHGASVHFVSPQVDAGPIIAQARVPVLAVDDPEALAARVLVQEHRLLPLVVRWFAQGRLELRDGRPVLDGVVLSQPLTMDEDPQTHEQDSPH